MIILFQLGANATFLILSVYSNICSFISASFQFMKKIFNSLNFLVNDNNTEYPE